MTNFGADTPFILLAKITVKEDKVSEYLELADKTDNKGIKNLFIKRS